MRLTSNGYWTLKHSLSVSKSWFVFRLYQQATNCHLVTISKPLSDLAVCTYAKATQYLQMQARGVELQLNACLP